MVEFPTIRISSLSEYKELDLAIERLTDFHWIIFTSPNGVNYFWRRLKVKGKDARWLSQLKIGAIGPKTALKLESMGIMADFLPDEYSSEGIMKGIAKFNIKGKRILLPRADIAPPYLLDNLRKLGANVEEVPSYQTQVSEGRGVTEIRNRLNHRTIDIVIFTSSSTVTNFKSVLPKESLQPLMENISVACIGPITAKTAQDLGFNVDVVAEAFTIDGLCEAILNFFSKK